MILESNNLGQFVIAFLSLAAGVRTIRSSVGALPENRFWRTTLGVVVLALSITYWMDSSHHFTAELTRDMRRGIGLVLYPCIYMNAVTIDRFWKNELKRLKELGSSQRDL